MVDSKCGGANEHGMALWGMITTDYMYICAYVMLFDCYAICWMATTVDK